MGWRLVSSQWSHGVAPELTQCLCFKNGANVCFTTDKRLTKDKSDQAPMDCIILIKYLSSLAIGQHITQGK